MELSSIGPALGRPGSDSSRGAEVEAGGLSSPPPSAPPPHFNHCPWHTGMFGALNPGFRSLATLKLVVIVIGELYTEKNSCGIARFPCDSRAFLSVLATCRVIDYMLAIYQLVFNVLYVLSYRTTSLKVFDLIDLMHVITNFVITVCKITNRHKRAAI